MQLSALIFLAFYTMFTGVGAGFRSGFGLTKPEIFGPLLTLTRDHYLMQCLPYVETVYYYNFDLCVHKLWFFLDTVNESGCSKVKTPEYFRILYYDPKFGI